MRVGCLTPDSSKTGAQVFGLRVIVLFHLVLCMLLLLLLLPPRGCRCQLRHGLARNLLEHLRCNHAAQSVALSSTCHACTQESLNWPPQTPRELLARFTSTQLKYIPSEHSSQQQPYEAGSCSFAAKGAWLVRVSF